MPGMIEGDESSGEGGMDLGVLGIDFIFGGVGLIGMALAAREA